LAEAGLEAHLSRQQPHKTSAEALEEHNRLQQQQAERKSYLMQNNHYYKEIK
jgi:hypothetical protein